MDSPPGAPSHPKRAPWFGSDAPSARARQARKSPAPTLRHEPRAKRAQAEEKPGKGTAYQGGGRSASPVPSVGDLDDGFARRSPAGQSRHHAAQADAAGRDL